MQFNASLDRTATAITIGVTILLVGVNVFVSVLTVTQAEAPAWIVVFPLLVTVATVAGCYLYRPLGYVVERDRLVIKRPIGDVVIQKQEIRNAFMVDKAGLGWVFRTFGNGGVFGWTGRFSSSKLGSMTWYATRRSHYLVIETSSRKILLTPDDPNMLSFVTKRLLAK